VGTAPAGDCGVLTVTLIISNNQITTGTVSGKHGAPTVRPASIAPDGTAEITYSGTAKSFAASLRFSGDQFTGNFGTFCGPQQLTGRRAP
jgi:hypothetical protein